MFVTMQLGGDTYTRTQLANITRFISKEALQPMMFIFRYADVLTLAIINRREHKRDPSKQVLEKVTLIKDIDLNTRSALTLISLLNLVCTTSLKMKVLTILIAFTMHGKRFLIQKHSINVSIETLKRGTNGQQRRANSQIMKIRRKLSEW